MCPRCRTKDCNDPDSKACSDKLLSRYMLALQEISEPLKFMQERAKAEGGTVNGLYAVQLCEDASYLRSIAKEALKG
jgi:hypothetical protein